MERKSEKTKIDQDWLAEEYNQKCAESLHALVLDRETVQNFDQLAIQPEMCRTIKSVEVMSVADQRATAGIVAKSKTVDVMSVAHKGGVAYSPGLEKPVAGLSVDFITSYFQKIE